MLGESPLYAVIPVSDLDDARRFYEDMLGIPPVRESETEILYRGPLLSTSTAKWRSCRR